MVCLSITLRPDLWAVLFNELERLAMSETWKQEDPAHATVAEVTTEIRDATDKAIFTRCTMIGQILELALDTVPDWLLLCDGASYLDADYPELGAVIHANLREGPDGFRVPDRLNRFALGGQPVGDQGGETAHTLTVEELPSHSHQWTDPGTVLITGGVDPLQQALADPGNPFSSVGYTGGDQPHNNMPPWEGTQFYIIARLPS